MNEYSYCPIFLPVFGDVNVLGFGHANWYVVESCFNLHFPHELMLSIFSKLIYWVLHVLEYILSSTTGAELEWNCYCLKVTISKNMSTILSEDFRYFALI